ncbi:MAG: hypothetical protein QME21_08085 [Anaerolineales bacterium]|nr:hypothetical protein [Anaerolineales bacterium]
MSFAASEISLPGLWPSIWKLLRLRLVILARSFRRSSMRRKIVVVFLGLLILAFLGFAFFISWKLLRVLRSPEMAQFSSEFSNLLEIFPTLVFSATFLGIFLTSFGVLLQALYLAGDMDFLLSTPLPIRAVFVAKLLQAALPNFALICAFALPVLFGIGASAEYTFLYYPGVLLEMAALALAAAGLSAMLVLLVVRIFPARRVAEVLGFLGAIFSILCSQSGQIAQWGEFSPEQATRTLSLLRQADVAWSPLTWAGRGVVSLGESNWLVGGGLTLLTLALAAAVFTASLVAAERLYYSGWAGMKSEARRRKTPRVASIKPLFPVWVNIEKSAIRLLSAPVSGLIAKDWLVLRRDLRNLSQLVTPLIIGVIYAVMILRSDNQPPSLSSPDASPWIRGMMSNLRTYLSVGLSLFVGWMLLARLAGMGFAHEGRSYWILKTAPISATQLILAKYLVAYLPSVALSGLYLLAIWLIQSAGLITLIYSLAVIALCIAGNAGINLAFGIAGANLNWEDPRQMQRTFSGCLGGLTTMLYLPLSLLLFFGPPIAFAAFNLPEAIGQIFGLALGGALSLACAFIPLFVVYKKVERLGED